MSAAQSDRSRPRVVVLFGGRSDEHGISCITAGSVLAALRDAPYDVVPVGITSEGRWVTHSGDPSTLRLGPNGALPYVSTDGRPVQLVAGDHGATLVVAGVEDGTVDVVFPLLHGPWGEDGTIQGQLEMVGVRYVGSGVLSSAVTMDKHYMKLVLAGAGLPVLPHRLITPDAWLNDAEGSLAAARELGFPLFVKPARGGSSYGISKVVHEDELRDAVEFARKHDPRVLIEGYAGDGARELECGVLGGEVGQPPSVSSVAEIIVHGHDFYDFEAKYLPDQSTDIVLPAELEPQIADEMATLAAAAFTALDCEGLARADFFLLPDGRLVINELNTMPGFTPTSMFPVVWEHAGVDYPSLVSRLLELALGRDTGLR